MNPRRQATLCFLLTIFSFLLYEITSYGGIRSPDSEIAFRTSEALASRGSVAVDVGLKNWKGFGLAKGVDGKEYSIFGPGQVLAAAPLVALGQNMVHRGFFRDSTFPLPVSQDVDDGMLHFVINHLPPNPNDPEVRWVASKLKVNASDLAILVANRTPLDRDNQGVRWVAAQLNIIATALTVTLSYLVALRMVYASAPALVTALLYGFGTLAWPYSGTFFSEPLTTLFGLGSFYVLLLNDPRFGAPSPRLGKTVFAGICLGIATVVHLSASLFAPFFLLYALYPYWGAAPRTRALLPAVGFVVGLAVVLALLGYHNFVRFGSPLETGRTVTPDAVDRFGFVIFTNPLEGLVGLLISSNKGLLLFSPITLMAAFAWPRLKCRHSFLAWGLVAMVAFRILFIASRSDWHGGFCLGPRYLVMILPYVCLPVALLAKDILQSPPRHQYLFATSAWLLICQQYYFSLGEIFSHYHVRHWEATLAKINLLANEQIYFEWNNSPLFSLLNGFRGPFLLRQIHADNLTVFLLGCFVLGVATCVTGMILKKDLNVTTARA